MFLKFFLTGIGKFGMHRWSGRAAGEVGRCAGCRCCV